MRLALVGEVGADAAGILQRRLAGIRRDEEPERPVPLRRHGEPEVGVAAAIARRRRRAPPPTCSSTAAAGMEGPEELVVPRRAERRLRGTWRVVRARGGLGDEEVAVERAAVGLAVVAEHGEALGDGQRPVEGDAAFAVPTRRRRQGADPLEGGGRGELQLPASHAHPPPRKSITLWPRREGLGEGEGLRRAGVGAAEEARQHRSLRVASSPNLIPLGLYGRVVCVCVCVC